MFLQTSFRLPEEVTISLTKIFENLLNILWKIPYFWTESIPDQNNIV